MTQLVKFLQNLILIPIINGEKDDDYKMYICNLSTVVAEIGRSLGLLAVVLRRVPDQTRERWDAA